MKPRLLFHCHHSLGLGHLVRSLALASVLREAFDVVLVAGGELPRGVELPQDVDVVPLAGATVSDRAEIVLETFRRLRPDVVVVELFPFGRKKLAGELLPMLEAARDRGATRPLVACSVRDILVRGRSDQAAHDERAARTLNELFDVVLVHADERFVRLDETFRPRTPLRLRVEYTGFVASGPPLRPRPRTGPVVVSAGGGRFGATLLRAAIHARLNVPVRIVAGPFLGDAEWRALNGAAEGRACVELVRTVPDLARELARARASVSRCGYNTALDLVRSRVPAVVVPFAAPGEDEQTRRAALLARMGAVRVLEERNLTPDVLASEVAAVLATPTAAVGLDLDGARRTRDILAEWIGARRRGAA